MSTTQKSDRVYLGRDLRKQFTILLRWKVPHEPQHELVHVTSRNILAAVRGAKVDLLTANNLTDPGVLLTVKMRPGHRNLRIPA